MFKYDGLKALKLGKTDYAMECFRRATGIKEDREVRENMARVCVVKDDFDSAIEHLLKVLELVPDDLKVMETLAKVSYEVEKYDVMDDVCAKALAVNDGLAFPHLYMGKKAKATGDMLGAVAQTTMAIAADKDCFEAYKLRANTLAEMAQYADAVRDVDYILEHDANADEEVKLQKADLCACTGAGEEAIARYREVIDYNPFIPAAYVKLSLVLQREKSGDDAMNALEEGLEQNPESSELYKARGGLRLALGDKEGAADDLKRSLELAPEEEKKLTGEFKSMESKMLDSYNMLNPYQLQVKI